MNVNKLNTILSNHKLWLQTKGEKGQRANLRGANLRGGDLSGVDLSGADLSVTKFRGANFRGANFRGADFRGADLSVTNFREADLSGADFRGADFRMADLNNANLDDVIVDEFTSFFYMTCPKESSYIAYKKAFNGKNWVIIKLLIPEDAKRSSATSRKCRASKAKVLSITSVNGETEYFKAYSGYDHDFIYRTGEIVSVDNFDENRWNECSTGIHHFLSRIEAVNYM